MQWGYSQDSISIYWFAGGAPPPPARVGPHPHALPALASVAPMLSRIWLLELAIWSASLSTELLNQHCP